MPTKYLPLAQLAETDLHLIEVADLAGHPDSKSAEYTKFVHRYAVHTAVVASVQVLRRSAAGLPETNERLRAACEYMENASSGLGVMPGDKGVELAQLLTTARMKIGPRK